MIWSLLGELVPAAAGVALSPFPVIAIVLVCGGPHARIAGPAFALGWLAGLGALTTVIVLLAGPADDPTSATADGVQVGRLLFGVLLLALAARKWRGRPRPGEEAEEPAWMASVDQASGTRALGLGAVLGGVNPKNIALTFAAAAAIAEAGTSTGDAVVGGALYVLLASSSVLGVVIVALAGGQRGAEALGGVKEFMAANATAIMVLILLLFGLKLVSEGLGGVFG